MKRRDFLSFGALAPAAALLSGCEPETLQEHAQAVVDQLHSQLKSSIDPSKPLIVASFVNVDDLASSSTFGHTMAEMVSTRLAQAGVLIADVRVRAPLVHRAGGELALSREAVAASRAYDAQAVLVGTYAVMPPRVYASIKVIRATDNIVLAATDTELRYEG